MKKRPSIHIKSKASMKFVLSFLSFVALASAAPADQRSPLVCVAGCDYIPSTFGGPLHLQHPLAETCVCPGNDFAGVCPAECNLSVVGFDLGQQVLCSCAAGWPVIFPRH